MPESFRLADYADCLSGFLRALDLAHRYVAGLSFGAVLALELFRRHGEVPQRLILASAYAGWAGSFRSDIVEERLRRSLEVFRLPAAEFVAAMLPSMFSKFAPVDRVAAFAANVAEFDPAGFRLMAKASAEADLRDVLAGIGIPRCCFTATRTCARHESGRSHLGGNSKITTDHPAGVDHINSVEAPDRFCAEVRAFLTER